MRYLSRFTVKTQLLAVLAGIWGLSLLLSVWLSWGLERAALQQTESSIQSLSQTIEVSLQQINLAEEAAQLNLLDVHTRLAPDVSHIILRAPDGRVVAAAPEGVDTSAAKSMVKIPFEVEGKPLGVIEVGMDFRGLREASSALFLRHSLLSLLLFGLGLCVAAPLAGYLARPLQGLAGAAGAVAGGKLEIDLPEPSSKEMSKMLQAFREMLVKLQRQRELEAGLAESEREAAIGRMAAGIAHDIRSPLNFISLALGQIKARMASLAAFDSKSSELVEEALTEMGRIKGITQDLNDFSRSGMVLETNRQQPAELLGQALETVRRRHPEQASRFQVADSAQEAEIEVNSSLLVRALVNLLENALEADPTGPIVCGVRLEDHEAVLHVEDHGPGIPEDRLGKIFLPYFTTKSSGIGLGLALASKWVSEMGGRVAAGNRHEGGALFELRFPVKPAVQEAS